MARKKSKYPTELELGILKLLWEDAPRTVREVRGLLAERGRELAHTTLITTLNVMYGKGFVTRGAAREGRGYAFSPKISRDEVSQGMVGDLIHRVFDGSAKTLVMQALSEEEASSEDLAEIRRMIDSMERKKK